MAKPDLQLIEHVYRPEDSSEDFCQVRISLQPVENSGKLAITLEPEVEMSMVDVENVLRYLERTTLRRLSLCLWEDCEVTVKQGDKNFTATLTGTVSVQELLQI